MAKTLNDGTASLDKALDVLDAIAAAPGGISQVELSALLDVPRTTLYRLLAALVARGMIRRDQQRRVYLLGLRCFELARQAYDMPDLVGAASTEMRALRDLTGETSYLAVLDGMEVVSLERCDGAHSQRSYSALGQRKPLYCTSQGKAILSALDVVERDRLVREIALRPATQYTITDRRQLLAELKITTARGYAVDDEEIVMGVRCVGAPIIDGAGTVRGAISVAGPAYRLSRERLELLGPELVDAARRVGAQLAYSRPMPAGAPQPLNGRWAFHGAYPQWCSQSQRLYWADTLAPAIRCFSNGQDSEVALMDSPIHALVLHHGGLLAMTDDGCWQVDPDSGEKMRVHVIGDALPRALCTYEEGVLWGALPSADGRWQVGTWSPQSGLQPQWHPGEAIAALCCDRQRGLLYAAAPQSGAILIMRPGDSVVRRLTSISRGSGVLSGIAVDAQGGVWAAMCDGWSVMRIAPDGNLDEVVGLSVPQPAGLAFGGDKGDMLFVTTSRHLLSKDVLNSAPRSGHLFCLAVATEN